MNDPIKITVNFAHREKIYNIDIDRNTTVGELAKEFLQVVEFNQKISFKFGQIQMDHERTLASYGVVKGSQLDLNIVQNEITIFVLYAQKNKVYTVTINLNSKVDDLKIEFCQILPEKRIILYYQGQTLDPRKTFADYGLKKGSQLDLRVEVGGNCKCDKNY